jgi:Family of unknown function (DUF6152)
MVTLGVAVALACLPGLAHHGGAAYDVTKKVAVKGTVKQWNWVNPHCLLLVDATDDTGQTVHWIMETQNPLSMSNLGWSNDMMKPGDQVTVRVTPAKNGKPIGLVVDIVLPNGKKLNARNILIDESKSGASPNP